MGASSDFHVFMKFYCICICAYFLNVSMLCSIKSETIFFVFTGIAQGQ